VFEKMFGSELEFTDSAPVAFRFNEALLEKVLTEDEMRELIGYQPKAASEQTIVEEINNPTQGEVAIADSEVTQEPQI